MPSSNCTPKSVTLRVATAAMVLALLGSTVLAQYALEGFAMDGGGGASAGGAYSLDGTVGPAEPEVMGGGVWTLEGTFWPGLALMSSKASTLFIQRIGGQLSISWSPPTPGVVLETTDDLATAAWTRAPLGNSNPTTWVPDTKTRFFRLTGP